MINYTLNIFLIFSGFLVKLNWGLQVLSADLIND